MIDTSAAYKTAVVADVRRVLISAVIDLIDPDIVHGPITSSGEAPFSETETLRDKTWEAPENYPSLELNRWLMDGSVKYLENIPAGRIGFVGDTISGPDCELSYFVEEHFSNVSILQAASIVFSTNDFDGLAVDFTVQILCGGAVEYSKAFTGNHDTVINLRGFTVSNPDTIRLTITKWSLPSRFVRCEEILPGVYDNWDSDMLVAFSATQRADFSCMTLPIGDCTLTIDNLDRAFEPMSKDGLFQSIEDRQGIQARMGFKTEDGDELVPIGTFYQSGGGWKTGANGLTMTWSLVDIIGLVAGRKYVVPDTLPTKLSGWLASIVGQLGVNFADRWMIDDGVPDADLTCTADDLNDITCGDLLRFACMAAGAYPRADAATGKLRACTMGVLVGEITTDNLEQYPTVSANQDVAFVSIQLNDNADPQTVLTYPGNSTSDNTLAFKNPFIKTSAAAQQAAQRILAQYGGNAFSATGRGNPAFELGDVVDLQYNRANSVQVRLKEQTLAITDGVLKGCSSVFVSSAP